MQQVVRTCLHSMQFVRGQFGRRVCGSRQNVQTYGPHVFECNSSSGMCRSPCIVECVEVCSARFGKQTCQRSSERAQRKSKNRLAFRWIENRQTDHYEVLVDGNSEQLREIIAAGCVMRLPRIIQGT